MPNGDPTLGPLMHRPRPRFKHEIRNPYLIVTTWANILRRLYDRDPTPTTALYITMILEVQRRTIMRLRRELSLRSGKYVVGTSLGEWDAAYDKYRVRLEHYVRILKEIRKGEREATDLHTDWFLPLFRGDYSSIVGMSKTEYIKGAIEFGFVPPKGWPPDIYTGATLYNQVSQAESLLTPLDFVNRVIGWGNRAETLVDESMDKAKEYAAAIKDTAAKYLPHLKKTGELLLYGALGLGVLIGGVAIYNARSKAMRFIGPPKRQPSLQGAAA